jgi:hypothetical protein
MAIEARLTNTSTGEEFEFPIIENLDDSRRQSLQSVPFAGTNSQSTILFPLSGKEEEFQLDFVLVDDGTDRSGGTASSPVVTVIEQIEYLRNNIDTSDIQTEIQLEILDYLGAGKAVEGRITSMRIQKQEGQVTTATGSFTLKLGKVGIF